MFAAALYYYFKCGLSFSEAIIAIVDRPVSTLCQEIVDAGDSQAKRFLGETANMKPEILANIDRGLRNKLMLFATDPHISHAFRGKREGAVCFTWEDLDTHNIFLRIPADKIEQWSGAVNLMYSQLIRHLERRPEMYSKEGANNVQTLLLMDEFARFGKLEMITGTLSTLRSKNVNICLMIQSVAQLDRIYDGNERRIIFDNCRYKVILRAEDADTQKYLCELIGTRKRIKYSMSEHFDKEWTTTGYSKQISEDRALLVQPHELSTLKDVLLLTPVGFCRAQKFRMDNKKMWHQLFSLQIYVSEPILQFGGTPTFDPFPKESAPLCKRIRLKSPVAACQAPDAVTCPATIAMNRSKRNEGATIMSIEERSRNANKRIKAAEQQRRQKEWSEQRAQERKDRRRHCIIGELVAKYFPTVQEYEPGTDAENHTRFEPLEAFLYVLSSDPDLVDKLQKQADQLVSEDPDGEWREPD